MNCKHVACTEIRAAALSNECSFFNEFGRGLILADRSEKKEEEEEKLKPSNTLYLLI